jgi:hypothetical protein
MLPIIARLVSSLPSAVTLVATKAPQLAARLGIASSKISVTSLANLAKRNKFTAALIAYELYGPASELVQEMMESDPELAKILESLAFQEDKVDDTNGVNDITKFSEEFETITQAMGSVGGLDNLLTLRNALSLSDSTYALFIQVREMKRYIG